MERLAIMEYVVSALWIALELFAILLFIKAFLQLRQTNGKMAISFLGGWLIIYASINVSAINPFSVAIKYTVIFLISLYLFRGSWYAHVLLAIIIILFITITDSIVSYGTSALLKISLEELIWRKNTYIAIGTLNKLIVLFFTWLIFHFRNVHGLKSIHRKWFLIMLMFPLISMIILILNYYNNQNNQDISIGVLLISTFLAAANMGVIYLIHSLEKQKKRTA